ncbi:MAG: putative 4-hydroxybenzoate polyprenyltransferase [Bacteroidia bacterium]|nr:putative 4-hydroxybenzoate polyprenyltransferase [Bacteroidia bacterium]MDW8348571.1 4-hydroxybenzoate octaprenyltransferase [Bacteroidia bacterium]
MVIQKYLSLVKFSHTIFAMPFAIVGFVLGSQAQGFVEWQKLILVVLCMVFARNAAMAFNRYADREIDKNNPRTANREIPAGVITPKNALIFVILNCVAFIVTTFFINRLCFYLSPVALLVILGYSLTKRFTVLCHFILGIGLSLAPIGAYLAVVGKFEWLPLYFSFMVLSWVAGFDIIYALQDEEFDKAHKLNSIPAWIGRKNAILLSIFVHLITAFFVIWIGIHYLEDITYWSGAGLFLGILFYQHTLVTPKDISKVNIAFFTANGIGSVVYGIFTCLSVYV